MEQTYGRGLFGSFAFFTLSLGASSVDLIILLLTFLTMQPQVHECTFADPQPSDVVAACTVENICAADSMIASYEVDWSSQYSLHNWVEKLDLLCSKKVQIGMLGASFFAGWITTLLWLPRLSDMYTRKKIFGTGLLVNTFVFIGILTTRRLEEMIAYVFVLGIMTTTRNSVCFVYLMELLPKRMQSTYGGNFNALNSSILPCAILYFWFVSNDWIYIHYLGLTVQVMCLVCVVFLPESPRLLIELQKLEEARQSFQRIAQVNKCHLEFNEKDFRRPSSSDKKEGETGTGKPLAYWFAQPKIRTNLVVMTVIWTAATFN